MNRQSSTVLMRAIILILLIAQPAQAFRFVVCSDCRAPKVDWSTQPFPYNLFNKDVIDYITTQIVGLDPQPEFVMCMGDLINRAFPNAGPEITTSNLDYWKTYVTDRLSGIDLYVAVGNSDLYGVTWWTELPLQTQFALTFNNMPDNGPTDPVDFRHLVYSFEHGEGSEKSLFVVLDSFGIYSGGTNPEVHADNDYDPYPYPPEQINWFIAQGAASDANHQFVFTHGPAFSVEGYPIQRNVMKIWDAAINNNFDTLFCAHEHLFYRWNVTQNTFPSTTRTLIQNLTGTAGAVPDTAANVNANPGNRIYFGYNFVVVDVEGSTITERAYAVIPNGSGFMTKLIDTTVIVK